MSIDKLAVWVHPLWSSRDLGTRIVESWVYNIERFAQDPSYGFVLTGCPEDSVHNGVWASRVLPVIHSLPSIFGERYIRWPENYIEGGNLEHTKRLTHQFKIDEPKFHELGFPIGSLFKEARVDGLIPGHDYCVADQRRKLSYLCPPYAVFSWAKIK